MKDFVVNLNKYFCGKEIIPHHYENAEYEIELVSMEIFRFFIDSDTGEKVYTDRFSPLKDEFSHLAEFKIVIPYAGNDVFNENGDKIGRFI